MTLTFSGNIPFYYGLPGISLSLGYPCAKDLLMNEVYLKAVFRKSIIIWKRSLAEVPET